MKDLNLRQLNNLNTSSVAFVRIEIALFLTAKLTVRLLFQELFPFWIQYHAIGVDGGFPLPLPVQPNEKTALTVEEECGRGCFSLGELTNKVRSRQILM